MWTSPKPMIAPFASGPGMRTPGDQYGWSVEAHRARPVRSRRARRRGPRARRRASVGPGDLGRAELALEPLDHPVARGRPGPRGSTRPGSPAGTAGRAGSPRRSGRWVVLIVAVVPYDDGRDRPASSAPEPRTSQALSAAAAMTGRPGGRPVASAASAVSSPSRSVGGDELRQPGGLDRARPSSASRRAPPSGRRL